MILFLGSTEISKEVLNTLVKNFRCFVITKLGSEVASFCKLFQIQCWEVKTLKNFDLQGFGESSFDFLLTVDFGLLVPKSFLELPKIAPLNIHASLLPKFRGAAPLQWAIFAGETETGITYMRMDESLDGGSVYTQFKIPITDSTTYTDLRQSVKELSKETVIEVLEKIRRGKLTCIPQDDSKATFAPKITAEFERLKIATTFKTLRHINALSLKPGAYVIFKGRRLKILKAKRVDDFKVINSNEFRLFNQGKKLYLECLDGHLEILLCQFEGGKVVSAEGFINGFRGEVNETIEND